MSLYQYFTMPAPHSSELLLGVKTDRPTGLCQLCGVHAIASMAAQSVVAAVRGLVPVLRAKLLSKPRRAAERGTMLDVLVSLPKLDFQFLKK